MGRKRDKFATLYNILPYYMTDSMHVQGSPVQMCRQVTILPPSVNYLQLILHTGLHYEPSSGQGDLAFAAYYS